MDPGSLSFSVCVILLCVLGETRCSNAGLVCQCPCPEPPLVLLTETPQATNCCQTNGTYRYKCKGGYTRKAGTSNLIMCKKTGRGQEWSTSRLTCIPDPKRTTTQQPKTTVRTVLANTNSEQTPSTSTQPGEVDPVKEIRASDRNMFGSQDTIIRRPDTTPPASHHGSDAIALGLSALAALIIVCAVTGIAFYCYKRRSTNVRRQQPAEELTAMNPKENLTSGPTS